MSEKKTAVVPRDEGTKPAAASGSAPVPATGGSYVRDPATGQLVRQSETTREAPKDRRNGPVASLKQGD